MKRSTQMGTILKEKSIGCRGLDLTGSRFGKLTVLEPDRNTQRSYGLYWKCKCDCGGTCVLRSDTIRKHARNCGCVNKIDLIGKRFGHLLVLKMVKIGKRSLRFWECKCDCGNIVKRKVSSRELIKKEIRSCGCVHNKAGVKSSAFKGYKEIYLSDWNSWRKGAASRGIPFNVTIEYAWLLFEKQNRTCALSGLPIHLGKQTRKNEVVKTASIDRIDSTKGYENGNIQWVHKDVNMMKRNMISERFIKMCELVYKHNKKILAFDTSLTKII